jgi:phosphoribosylformylglycinamidine synthase
MRVRVDVSLKPGVLDPEAQAIANGLHALDFPEVRGVRVSKSYELELEGEDLDRVTRMCEALLANTVVERYRITRIDG